jgi:hypothetical protein
VKGLFKYNTNTWVRHKPSGLRFEVMFISYVPNYRSGPLYSGVNGDVTARNFPEHELEPV